MNVYSVPHEKFNIERCNVGTWKNVKLLIILNACIINAVISMCRKCCLYKIAVFSNLL